MTREGAKELLPIIQAFAEGKTIQYKSCCGWEDVNDSVLFVGQPYEYRIKPETKYRPFKTQKECWNEMHNHPDFGRIMKKDNGELTLIYGIYESMGKVWVKFSHDSFYDLNVTEIFHIYTFADGEPFGIKEE